MTKDKYLKILEKLVSLTEREYLDETTGWVNPFAQAASQAGDPTLGERLRRCATRADAIRAVKQRLYELGLLSWNPDREVSDLRSGVKLHSDEELVKEALERDDQILSEQSGWTRKSLIARIQQAEQSSQCIGEFANCRSNPQKCRWSKDCREMSDLPPIANQVIDPNLFPRPARKKVADRQPAPGKPPTEPEIRTRQERPAGPERQTVVCLEFSRAEGLVGFLDVAIQSRGTAGVRQEIAIRPAKEAGGSWGLLWPREISPDLENLLPIFQGRRVESLRFGQSIPLNTFLEQVPLKQRRQMPQQVPSVFVLVNAEHPKELQERVCAVYQSFPRGLHVECQFLPGNLEGLTAGRQMLLLFSGFQGSPLVRDWITKLPQYATAFYPLTPARDNVFFCQWGFVHPVVALPRLYEANDAQFILLRYSRHPGVGWIIVPRAQAAQALRGSRQVLAVSFDQALPASRLFVVEEDFEPYELPLRATAASSGGLPQLTALARQIETHRQAISHLERRYEKLQQWTAGQYRVALVYFDPTGELSSDQAGQFPERLRRFLFRPSTLLSNFEYFYLPSPRPGVAGRHVLVSRLPVALSEVLISCADEIYLQDPRWQGWGVNIFCERHLELSPRLDDPIMAQKLMEHLIPKETSEPIACWLITALGKTELDEDAAGSSRLVALAVPQSRLVPLPEAFRVANVQKPAVLQSAFEESAAELAQWIDKRCAEAVAQIEPVYQKILSHLEPHLRTALEEWAALFDRLNVLRAQARVSAGALEKMERLLSAVPPNWERFLSTLMELQLDLSKNRMGLFSRLTTELSEFLQQKAEVEATFRRAKETLENIDQEIARAEQEIRQVAKEVSEKAGTIRRDFAAVQAERAKIEAQLKQLEQLIAGGSLTMDRLLHRWEQRLAQIEAKVDPLEKLISELQALEGELKDTDSQIARLVSSQQAALQQKAELAAQKSQAEQRIISLNQEISQLQQEISSLRAAIAGTDQQARIAQLQIEGLREAVDQLNDYLKKLRAEIPHALRQGKEFAETVRTLVKLLQTRPDAQIAEQAGLLFAKALLLVPYGFYPSEWQQWSPQVSAGAATFLASGRKLSYPRGNLPARFTNGFVAAHLVGGRSSRRPKRQPRG
jgi:predicted  nucleic acid-binding Zn-ribbon protein